MIKATYEANHTFVVVVGANSGIGQALIGQLSKTGATIFGIDIQDVPTIYSQKKYHYFKADPLNTEQMELIKEKIGKHTSSIQALVNLSGTIKKFKPIVEMDLKDWNETYDISFKSCFNSCKVFAPFLAQTSNAAIVNMSSGLAFIGQKNYGPYTSGKASVIAFSKTLAAELAPKVRVNTIAPGAVDTNFIYKEDGTTRFNKEQYTKMVPLGSMAKPQEISAVILFLLSDGASHMTGQCLHVNGGASMQ